MPPRIYMSVTNTEKTTVFEVAFVQNMRNYFGGNIDAENFK